MLEVVAVAGMDGGWRRGCDWSEAGGEIRLGWMSEAGAGEANAGGASGAAVRWEGYDDIWRVVELAGWSGLRRPVHRIRTPTTIESKQID